MDPNSSLGKICLGEDVVVISSDKVEGSGDWNSLEFQDTANSGQKKETKAMVFYKMDTEEVSDRFVAPCFVNGLEAYDGEINLGVEENMISNEYAVKLCLEHEVKRGNKVVKKELIVALRGEIYFVKFIINPEEDDVEPGVIFGRSFLQTEEEEEKSNDDWNHLLDFNIDDIPLLGTSSSAGGHLTQEEAAKEALAIRMSRKFALLEEERPIIETMAYHDKYKKILDEVWKDKVELDGKIVKEEEEAVKRIKGEALKEKDNPGAFIFPIRLEGHVNKNTLVDTRSDINTMSYRIYEQLGREDMKKVDRGIIIINHTQVEAMEILTNVLYQVGVTTLIAKFLILDIPIDRDSPIVVGRGFLRTIGGIINTPERLFSTFDGFCHKTFRAARSDVMRNVESDSDDEEDYQIQRNKFGAPIYGPKPAPYLNCNDPAERSLAIQTTMGTHDDEAGSSRSKRSRQHETMEEVLLPQVHHEFLLWEGCNRDAKSRYNTRLAQLLPRHIYSPCVVNWAVLNRMGCDGEIDDMLRIRLRKAGSDEEIFTLVAWIRAFNINEPIYTELCHEFYSTYKFDEVCADDELKTKKIIKFRLGGHAHRGLHSDEHFNAQDYWLSISREENLGLSRSHTSTIWKPILRVIHKMITYGLCQRTTGYDKVQKNDLWLLSMFDARHQNGVLTEDVVRSLSARIYCRDLDTTTLRDLIDFEGKLIPKDPQPGVPRVGIPRPPRASMQDLYQGVFEHMDGVYSVLLQGAYNPLGYAQPQYDQYYPQYPPPPPQYQQQQQDDDLMMSSVETTRDGYVTTCFGSLVF
ncbi:ribonuclease H-like domain-containing protein [Tanacetum coccineum]